MSFVAKSIILFSIALLLLTVTIKMFLVGADMFDRLTGLFALLLFLGDQLTR